MCCNFETISEIIGRHSRPVDFSQKITKDTRILRIFGQGISNVEYKYSNILYLRPKFFKGKQFIAMFTPFLSFTSADFSKTRYYFEPNFPMIHLYFRNNVFTRFGNICSLSVFRKHKIVIGEDEILRNNAEKCEKSEGTVIECYF